MFAILCLLEQEFLDTNVRSGAQTNVDHSLCLFFFLDTNVDHSWCLFFCFAVCYDF